MESMTLVQFAGNLVSQIIQDGNISHFNYRDLLRRMCLKDPALRISSFVEIRFVVTNFSKSILKMVSDSIIANSRTQ